MKQKLLKVWEWEGIDYMIDIAMILVLFGGGLHAQQANQTLENNSCTVYWETYNPEVNLSSHELVNATERRWIENPGLKQRQERENLKPIEKESEKYG